MTGFAKASDLEFHIRTDWKHAHKIWENLYKEGSPITALLPIHQLDGTKHTVSGLTAGHVLTALTPTTFGFAAPVGGDIPAHQLDGAKHTVSGLTPGHFLKALTATTFGFAVHGLTYSDVGAAASGHNHSGVYDPAGTGDSEATAHVAAHAPLITGVHGLVFTAGKSLTLTESLTLNALPIGGLAVATGANTLGSLAVGVAGQYLAGGGAGTVPSWATLNQAAVDGLKDTQGPSFAHVHATDVPATGGALITAAESWIGPSSTAGIYFKGGYVGIGGVPDTHFYLYGHYQQAKFKSDSGEGIYFTFTNLDDSGIGYFGLESAIGGTIFPGSIGKSTVVGSGSAHPLHFMTNGTIKSTILSNGQFLIGAMAAAYTEKLAVIGANGGIAGIHLNDATPSTTTCTLYRSGNDLYWGTTKLN